MKSLIWKIFLIAIVISCSENTNDTKNEDDILSIKIGAQIWMQENLSVTHYRNGDPIQQVTDPDEWSNLTTGAWCYYDNNSANGKIYGKLYNWYAVNDPRGLAPDGWHVASDEEWLVLEMTLGMGRDEADVWGYRGTIEGTMLAGNYDLWEYGDLRNNSRFGSSGFAALPGGYRKYNIGSFNNIGGKGYWWSSTDVGSPFAINRKLSYFSNTVDRSYNYKSYGFSVRCVRD